MIFINKPISIFMVISVLEYSLCSATIHPFYNGTDNIETIDANDFIKNVLHSNRITVLEFYANWCSYSKSFIPHWKQFSNDTRLWQKRVLRVAAIDCAFDINDKICWENNILEFPQFRFYHARTENKIGVRKEDENSRSEKFMRATIDFIEKQRHPPRDWPRLTSYIGDLSTLFESDPDMKHVILIFEEPASYLGRKLILDFSDYLEKIMIRRVTYDKNRKLYEKFGVQSEIKIPILYLVTNSHDENKPFEKFEDAMMKLDRNKEHNTVDDGILQQQYGIEQTSRYIYMKQIFDFIKYTDLEFDFNEHDL